MKIELIQHNDSDLPYDYRWVVVVEWEEMQLLKLLLPAFERLLAKEERRLERLDALRETGDITEKQLDKRMLLMKKIEGMRHVKRFIDKYESN
jgi:hypothetical protein